MDEYVKALKGFQDHTLVLAVLETILKKIHEIAAVQKDLIIT